ncbi:MAG: ADP-ribosylglycohydrolase family protein [Bacillota bacterium]
MENYEQKIYGGVLGKTIGVYIGRPFEGWYKEAIEERFGKIDRYVNEEMGAQLVVTDDDLTGTFTFMRILEDSGDYADTAPELYGANWLNYIIPNKSILWWGGVGISTEHTAFKNLKNGIPAPQSGTIAQNGKIVAEQIGAQIFIEGFGMVAPGKPELAAKLARRAAEVSHDGAAVDAAIVVAVMTSLAFVQNDIDGILRAAQEYIEPSSAIYEVHQQVRDWVNADNDWQRTYYRIKEKYGYDKFGGLCHVIPNHAIMVMSWLYGGADFDKAMAIINTAGWDTDCNAANVGCVLGIMLGADKINEQTNWRAGFNDRLLLPTAEGTYSVTDCANVALQIAAVGRKIMGWSLVNQQSPLALHNFTLPGSLHGYMVEGSRTHKVAIGKKTAAAAIDTVTITNYDGAGMTISGRLQPDEPLRLSTPLLANDQPGNYGFIGCSRIQSGNTILARVRVSKFSEDVSIKLFLRCFNNDSKAIDTLLYSTPVSLVTTTDYQLELTVPQAVTAIYDVGLEISSPVAAEFELVMTELQVSGNAEIEVVGALPVNSDYNLPGWIVYGSNCVNPLLHTTRKIQTFVNNDDRGLFCIGTRDWNNYVFETDFVKLCATRSGIVVRYQGLERYLALTISADKLQIIRRYYADELLFEREYLSDYADKIKFKIVTGGEWIKFYLAEELLYEWREPVLLAGAVGYLVEQGTCGFERMTLKCFE